MGTGIGSALFHAGGARVGFEADVLLQSLLPYVVYLAVVQSLPFSTVLYVVSNTTRTCTALELTIECMRIMREDPIEDWVAQFRQIRTEEIPNFELTFGAIVNVANMGELLE